MNQPQHINPETREKLITILREKELKKSREENRNWKKWLQFTTLFSALFNFFVLCDLLVFTPVVTHDVIAEKEIVGSRGMQYDIAQIYTEEGKFWTIDYSRYDFPGHQIVYAETPFFGVADTILNQTSGHMMLRYIPAFWVALISSVLLLTLSVTALILYRLKKTTWADHLTQLCLISIPVQVILFWL